VSRERCKELLRYAEASPGLMLRRPPKAAVSKHEAALILRDARNAAKLAQAA